MFWTTLTTGIVGSLVGAGLPAHAVLVAERGPAPTSTVSVASANLREGSAVRHSSDLANGDDRAAFARRLLGNDRRLPDVLLLQEVLGSARTVAKTLTQHPRVRRSGARYVVVVAPRLRRQHGPCAGPRQDAYSTLRDSAILVNTTTVRAVHARGVVRTWGRWRADGAAQLGRAGYGCAEHPWVRVTVRQPGRQARTARLMSAHVAPAGTALKRQAVRHIRTGMDGKQRRTPSDLLVIGGDFNYLRCALDHGPETATCPLRAAHGGLVAAGYRDAVLSRRPTGPHGAAGVTGRIDFIYAKARVIEAGFDRCYLAFRVRRHRCAEQRTDFRAPSQFRRCQRRSLHFGTPDVSCRSGLYHRYYSDHPAVWATLR